MKGCRKCKLRSEDDDSVCNMVNKGAQKIITEGSDHLTSVFSWTLLTGAFIIFLVIATCVVLRFESPSQQVASSPDGDPKISYAFRATAPPVIVKVATDCPSTSKDSLEQTVHPVSKLIAMDIGSDGIHYVFTNSTDVPQSYPCSVESALRTMGNDSRVNVFIIDGIVFKQPPYDGQTKVSLLESLDYLTATYGGDRLKVVRISLEECLVNSPFRGMSLSRRSAFATFVVKLVLLWQFGGTVMDAGLMVRGDNMYPSSRTVVEYGYGMVSSPVACNAFVYDVMRDAMNIAYAEANFDHSSFSTERGCDLVQRTVESTGRTGSDKEVRRLVDKVVCKGAVVDSRCYFVEVDDDATFDFGGFCPVVSVPRENRSQPSAPL